MTGVNIVDSKMPIKSSGKKAKEKQALVDNDDTKAARPSKVSGNASNAGGGVAKSAKGGKKKGGKPEPTLEENKEEALTKINKPVETAAANKQTGEKNEDSSEMKNGGEVNQAEGGALAGQEFTDSPQVVFNSDEEIV